MTIVRVKHKGQVTIPAELRAKFNITEGTNMNISEHPEGILLRSILPPEPGPPVGEEVYENMLTELEQTRHNWR
jgi:AbrB family looped-hinge helix DNA binding protein